MEIFKNLFLIKRPKQSVLEKSEEYEKEGNLSKIIGEPYMNKRECMKYGFEDGYLQCLQDLGINYTVNGKLK